MTGTVNTRYIHTRYKLNRFIGAKIVCTGTGFPREIVFVRHEEKDDNKVYDVITCYDVITRSDVDQEPGEKSTSPVTRDWLQTR